MLDTLTAVKKDSSGDGIKALVKKYIAKSNVLSDVGTELSFQLPEASSGKFPSLFRQLDGAKVAYGVSVTTLEEVFLKVAEMGSREEIRKSRDLARKLSSADGSMADDIKLDVAVDPGAGTPAADAQRALQGANPARQFTALVQKRLRYASRDWRNLACNILLPVVLLSSGLCILKYGPVGKDDPPFTMTTDVFNPESSSPSLYVPVSNPGDVYQDVLVSTYPSDPKGYDVVAVDAAPFAGDFTLYDKTYTNGYLDGQALGSDTAGEGVLAIANSALPDGVVAVPDNWHKGTSVYGGVAIEAATPGGAVQYAVVVNSTATHGFPTFVNVVNEALLKSRSGVPSSAKITVTSAPLPKTAQQQSSSISFLHSTAPYLASLLCRFFLLR